MSRYRIPNGNERLATFIKACCGRKVIFYAPKNKFNVILVDSVFKYNCFCRNKSGETRYIVIKTECKCFDYSSREFLQFFTKDGDVVCGGMHIKKNLSNLVTLYKKLRTNP